MTVPGSLRGVLLRPRPTLEGVVRVPSWVGILAVCTLASAISLGLLYSTQTGRIALVDQWERTAFALGWPLDDARYADLVRWSQNGVAYAVARALVIYPGLTVLAAAVLRAVARGAATRQCLALAAHAGVVLAVRDLVSAPLAYARETTASATTLGQWFPLIDEGSTWARLLGSVDLFAFWWLLVLAVGAGVLTGRPARRWATPFLGAYCGLAFSSAATLAWLNRG